MADIDETNVCYLCETTHDCAEGNEVEALSGEWVCLPCQDKLAKLRENSFRVLEVVSSKNKLGLTKVC